jgi:hypothetical protein
MVPAGQKKRNGTSLKWMASTLSSEERKEEEDDG